jgi:hypothetical protein
MRQRAKSRRGDLPENSGVGKAGMIEALGERVNGDEMLVRRGRFLTTTFLLEVGPTAWLIAIFEGRIVSVTSGPFVMPSSSLRCAPANRSGENSGAPGRRPARMT